MRKKILYSIAILVGIVLIGLAYYTISPLFIRIEVNDPNPIVDNSSSTDPVRSVASVPVVGTAGHPASGTVRIVEADGKKYVRYENFKTINGPDIYVYLAKDIEAKEFVNLGRVRATEGNVNYEIPAEISVADYPYVLTWCKAFGVLFNSAKVL